MTASTWRRSIVVTALAIATAAGQTAAQTAAEDRLYTALGKLAPQRPGVVDAYIVVISLDQDPVFGREARETARVLSARFDGDGRTVLLADAEAGGATDAVGSPANLDRALARVAAVMDRKEDVLVLYSTSHGRPRDGLLYRVGDATPDTITSFELASSLNRLGFQNRLVVLQACYSGQFVPALASDTSIVITAAARDRSSFGCTPGNDWTFFGHAFVNQALRTPSSLMRQFTDAEKMIAGWEKTLGVPASRPQISFGRNARAWLQALEARAPKTATAPVGQAPIELGE